MSTAPEASACSRMPVLPRPCLCTAGRPAATSVCVTISPRMYDSVKRFEPTTTTASFARAGAARPASAARMQPTAAARRRAPTRETASWRWCACVTSSTLRRSFSPVERAPALSSAALFTLSPQPWSQELPGPARERLPMTQLRAFIVEDSPVIRENLVAALEEMAPINVVGTAEDEASALGWLAGPGHPCDLVVVDIFLKSGSGLGVLKSAAAAPTPPKLVVLSNYATPDMRRRSE